MDKESLTTEITRWRNDFKTGQYWWSVAHHSALFGSIACSISAGAVLQLTGENHTGAATILTSLAAALTGIATSGGFARKWRTNRLSRSRMDLLLIDLETDTPDLNKITQRFKEIVSQHDSEVVDEKPV